MKQHLRSLNSFTRTQRIGIVALCAIIVILLGIRISLNYLPSKEVDINANQQLAAAYQNFLASQPKPDTLNQDYADHGDGTPLPNIININTADSATLVRLKGIGPAFAHKIIQERTRKPFTNINELRDVQAIPAATWAIISPHLQVSDTAQK